MNEKISMQFTSQLSQLNDVRDFVRSSCTKVFTKKFDTVIDLIVLAVNEAFTNIVIHAYGRQPHHEILIITDIGDDYLSFELADQGTSFNLNSVVQPDLTGTRENGFGVYIMKTVMEDVSYTQKKSQSDWNYLKLTKKL